MLSNGAPPHMRNGSASNGGPRDPSFRHMSTGSLNIPNGLGPQNGASNGQPQIMGPMAPGQRLDGPRSPPGKQSTSRKSRTLHFFGRVLTAGVWQILPTYLANSLDKALVRLAKRVRSVMI